MEVDQKLGRLLSAEKNTSKLEERLATSCRQFFTQKVEFHAAKGPDSHLEHLKSRYTPLNRSYRSQTAMEVETENAKSSKESGEYHVIKSDGIPEPKMVLFNDDQLVMGWKEARAVGSGLCNLSNTCFLNSVLQCLTYTPPLFNYVSSGQHSKNCNTQAFCAMCEFHRHCTRVFNSTNGLVKPIPIVKNLRAIARHFHQGRQEDAHEFLRYFIDSLQKCCLHGINQKLDVYSKSTTLVHQIFGGYHRSQVKCLDCSKMSNTFDPLLDVSVDIKNSSTLVKALQHYIRPDLLDGDNSYACPYCKKMTRAQKRLTVHRLPNVLTIQLKRFDYNSMFGGKVNKQMVFAEHLNMRPYMSEKEGPSEWYRLYGVLVHFGFSCHSGHYYCYIRNSNNVWFCMNDSQVTQVSLSTVLQQEAYLLFYIRDRDYKPCNIPFPPGSSALKNQNSSHFKSDPNFLGTPVKRVTPLSTGLDKSRTPLVKLHPPAAKLHPPAAKPTGVVQPSPQKDTSKQPVGEGQSSSPPTTNGVPKAKSQSPSSSGSGTGSGGTSPMLREFSIPLRKITTEKMEVARATSQQSPQRPQQQTTPTTSAAVASLRFTPRQITAPPKTKKHQKMATAPSVSVNPETEKSEGEGKVTESSVTQPTIDMATSITGQTPSGKTDAKEETTILDFAETKPAPAFKAIQAEEPHQSFVGPLLPPSSSSPSSPSLPQSPLRMTPFSLKTPTTLSPKVALVQPQPQSRGKPVARVRPNPHHQEGKGDEQSSKESHVTSTPGHVTSTPGPHMNAVTPWKVREATSDEAFGPTLPEGRDYNSSAHGWNVSTISGGEESHTHKPKKHKKKKKHRKREEDGGNESEVERGGKKDRGRKESKKSKSRDLSHSPERSRHHSSEGKRHHHHDGHRTPERSFHHHDLHRTPDRSVHYDKYRKHRRHSYRERDRDRHKYKGSHHSHHNRSRSPSRSRSRSPLNETDERHRHRERHRTSPHRHTHYHTPLDSEEDGYRKMKNGYHSRQQSDYHRVKHSSDSSDKRVNNNGKSDEARRRERKRSYHHDNERDGGSEEEREYKKHKKTGTVPIVEWDGSTKAGSKWDGSHHTSTVEQLTSLSHRTLGENVKSWDGKDNIIDSSKTEGEGQRRERDSWDAELDKGKVKKIKMGHHGNQFSSGRNVFQDFQNKRNVTSQTKSDT